MAVEPPRAPEDFGALTYVYVIVLSLLGGLVKFLGDWNSRRIKGRIVIELAMDLVTSAFVGLLTFWACEALQIAPAWVPVCVGVAAHMGTRAIALFGRVLLAKLNLQNGHKG